MTGSATESEKAARVFGTTCTAANSVLADRPFVQPSKRDRMNPKIKSGLLRIMDTLYSWPVNCEFMCPPEDCFVTYRDLIARPLDLARVRRRLDDDGYATTSEWYDDVCLVYQNCIQFHGAGTLWGDLGQYHLDKFRKLAQNLPSLNPKHWFLKLKSRFTKFVKAAGQGPVPQALDPVLENIIRLSEGALRLPAKEMAMTVEFLNGCMDSEGVRRESVYLLNRLQPDLELAEDENVIDVGKLGEASMNALLLYAKARASL
jgi:hypothetical protein